MSNQWTITIERRRGQPLIIGDAGEPRIRFLVGPRGFSLDQRSVLSGGKPEHGPGGFEVPVYLEGEYTLEIEEQVFEFWPFPDAMTWLTLSRAKPDVSGGPAPVPESEAERWDRVFERLDRIEALFEKYLAEVAGER